MPEGQEPQEVVQQVEGLSPAAAATPDIATPQPEQPDVETAAELVDDAEAAVEHALPAPEPASDQIITGIPTSPTQTEYVDVPAPTIIRRGEDIVVPQLSDTARNVLSSHVDEEGSPVAKVDLESVPTLEATLQNLQVALNKGEEAAVDARRFYEEVLHLINPEGESASGRTIHMGTNGRQVFSRPVDMSDPADAARVAQHTQNQDMFTAASDLAVREARQRQEEVEAARVTTETPTPGIITADDIPGPRPEPVPTSEPQPVIDHVPSAAELEELRQPITDTPSVESATPETSPGDQGNV